MCVRFAYSERTKASVNVPVFGKHAVKGIEDRADNEVDHRQVQASTCFGRVR